ncbi:hypothetical protein TrVFT333_006230 [Trichoderma virens FT-333]|nr:hypothetical protein TrVFT333_006230 [Trichoderma virens FT-333]
MESSPRLGIGGGEEDGGGKDIVSSSTDDGAAAPQQDSDKTQDALNTHQLNIDRFKEELAAIEKEFESWQEMGFSLPASK